MTFILYVYSKHTDSYHRLLSPMIDLIITLLQMDGISFCFFPISSFLHLSIHSRTFTNLYQGFWSRTILYLFITSLTTLWSDSYYSYILFPSSSLIEPTLLIQSSLQLYDKFKSMASIQLTPGTVDSYLSNHSLTHDTSFYISPMSRHSLQILSQQSTNQKEFDEQQLYSTRYKELIFYSFSIQQHANHLCILFSISIDLL